MLINHYCYFKILLLGLLLGSVRITPCHSSAFNLKNIAGDSHRCVDCAIVGGGPGGLATAIALSSSSPSSSIAIFEKDRFEPKGSTVAISPSGWKSIAGLDHGDGSLTTKLKETGVAVSAFENRPWLEEKDIDIQRTGKLGRLRTFVEERLCALKRKVTELFLTGRVHMWHDVRVALFEYAKERYLASRNVTSTDVDENSVGVDLLVNLGLTLEKIKSLSPSEEEDGARFELSFKSISSVEEIKIRARFLIACDGVQSPVRSILPNEPDVLLSEERSLWRGTAPNVLCSPGLATFFLGSRDSNSAGRSDAIFPSGKNAGLSWTVISDHAEPQRSDSNDESKRRVLRVIESMGKDSHNFKRFKEVIDDSPVIIENKLYVRDFDKPWEASYDGLIYVGDSAHPIRPTGEGIALALEDAYVLAKVVSEVGLSVKAFREYESERYESVKAISEKARKFAESRYD